MVNSDGLIHFECFKNGKQCSPAGSDGKESACNGILLSHKRNTFKSVLRRWVNLEPII